MATKKELCRAANGVFVRNIGWKVKSMGGYAQHKFYLGRDESKATLASLRLEQLWQQVCKRWQRENSCEIYPTDRPVWDEVTLAIAEAVRIGEAVARVPLPVPFSVMIPECPMIGDWLDRLQDDITVIKVELRDEKAQAHSEEFLQKQGQRLLEMGRRMLHKRAGGETLGAALDAYSRWLGSKYIDIDKRPTPWCGTQTRMIEFVKRHLPNCSLGELGTERVEQFFDVLRLRPNGENGKPVSVSWTQSCIKLFRRFLRWLSKAPEFSWKRPADLEWSRLRIPLTTEEKSAVMRSTQVETYSLDELQTLWEFGSPFQRLLLLLALNCGFGRAEVASLEIGEVSLRCQHPHAQQIGCVTSAEDSWIFRIRHKTGVYGEYKLWPKTVEAVDGWLRQRLGIHTAATTLLVNGKGQRYDAPTKGNHANFQICNNWARLTEQIRKVEKGFRRLSFNKLRKTAGNLIRAEAGGEIAAVFLCHGTPVKADDLLDVYTNRPFAKVFQAIDRLGERLRPLWVAGSAPFADDTISPASPTSRQET